MEHEYIRYGRYKDLIESVKTFLDEYITDDNGDDAQEAIYNYLRTLWRTRSQGITKVRMRNKSVMEFDIHDVSVVVQFIKDKAVLSIVDRRFGSVREVANITSEPQFAIREFMIKLNKILVKIGYR